MSEVKTKMNNSGNFTPYYVRDYLLKVPLSSNNAGNCMWGFAEKYGKQFFIKQFLAPKFPDADADIYEVTRKRMVNQCEEWYTLHEKVYNAVINCGGSNIINPLDFFLEKNVYYLITEKIESSNLKFEDIHNKSLTQQEIIMKVLAHEISLLAQNGIVHSDLKPDNLILKSTVSDFFTVKIIDFDASFLTSVPPEPDDIIGDQNYFSPEMLLYMAEEDVDITPKSDVFALGIIFHIILCGKFPKYSDDFDCLGQAVLNGDKPIINPSIRSNHSELIREMLCEDVEKRLSAEEVLNRLLKNHSPKKNITAKASNGVYINMKQS